MQRTLARKQLGSDIMVHVRAIRERYIVAGETAESALMFLPSEAVYAELHANLPEIVQQSYRERVWIVSPTTLMATLNTVRAVLRDARMREQAHVIQAEVRILLEDVSRLDDRASRLQKHFDQSLEDLRQIRISTDKVTRRAGRIEEVDVGRPEQPQLSPPRCDHDPPSSPADGIAPDDGKRLRSAGPSRHPGACTREHASLPSPGPSRSASPRWSWTSASPGTASSWSCMTAGSTRTWPAAPTGSG